MRNLLLPLTLTLLVGCSGLGTQEDRMVLADFGPAQGGAADAGGAGEELVSDPLKLDDGAGNTTFLSQGNSADTDGGFTVGTTDGGNDGSMETGRVDLYAVAGRQASLIGDTGVPFALLAGDGSFAWAASTTTNTGTIDTYLQRGSAGRVDVNSSLGGGGNGTLGATEVASPSGANLVLAARGATRVSLGSRASFLNEIALGSLSAPGFVMHGHSGVGVTLTESVATSILAVSFGGAEGVWSGLLQVNVYATDGTEHQLTSTLLSVTIINDGGTITGTATEVNEQTSAGSGTLTATFTVVDDGSNNASVRLDAGSSLTQTTLKAWTHVLSGQEHEAGSSVSIGLP